MGTPMCLTESEKAQLLTDVRTTHDAVVLLVPTVNELKPKVELLMSFKDYTYGAVGFVMAGGAIYAFIELVKWIKPRFL